MYKMTEQNVKLFCSNLENEMKVYVTANKY